MTQILVAALYLASIPATSFCNTDAWDALRWRNRVLVVMAPSAQDANLLRQLRIWKAHEAGNEERHLVLAELCGDGTSRLNGASLAPEQQERLRQRFAWDGKSFEVVLVGKDGGVKLRRTEPVSAEALFAIIDSMPMRRREMREQNQSEGTNHGRFRTSELLVTGS